MTKKNYLVTFVFVLFYFIISSGCKNKLEKSNTNSPNIVLIVIDALRSDHLPIYNYSRNTAPFLKELAKESIVFNNCFAASSWTAPATASIFTSMYPFQHGVLMGLMAILNRKKKDPSIKVNKIPEEIETITEVLKKSGYATYGIADNANIDKKEGFDQGFDKLITYNYKGAQKVNETLLKMRKDIQEKSKYFLYIHYMDPHAPYMKRKPWYRTKKGKIPISLEAYDSEISYIDKHIKQLYTEFNWIENTIFIFTSDHGEGLWDHGTMGHGITLYREEIQVPLLISFSKNKMFKRIDTNVSTIDILPTLREIIGLEASSVDEGESLLPLIYNKPNNLSKRYLFSHLLKKKDNKDINYNSVIYKKWHYISVPNKTRELFRMISDKKEQSNLYNFSKFRKIANKLNFNLRSFKKSCKKYSSGISKVKLSKKENEKLKTLGYINSEE